MWQLWHRQAEPERVGVPPDLARRGLLLGRDQLVREHLPENRPARDREPAVLWSGHQVRELVQEQRLAPFPSPVQP